MFSFKNILTTALSSIAVSNGQWLFTRSNNQLYVDVPDADGNVTREAIKDSTAGRTIAISEDVLSLKNASGTTISSITLPLNALELSVDLTTGHLYYDWNYSE